MEGMMKSNRRGTRRIRMTDDLRERSSYVTLKRRAED